MTILVTVPTSIGTHNSTTTTTAQANYSPLTHLRALKGAPLSCVVAMRLANQPVGPAWLESATGYAHQAITKALKILRELQVAMQIGRFNGWILTEQGQQLILPLAAAADIQQPAYISSGSYLSQGKLQRIPPTAEKQDSPVFGAACVEESRPCAPRARALARWHDDIMYLEALIHARHPENCYHCEHRADGCLFRAPDYGDWAVQAEIELAEKEGINTPILVWRIKALISGERNAHVPPSHRQAGARKEPK